MPHLHGVVPTNFGKHGASLATKFGNRFVYQCTKCTKRSRYVVRNYIFTDAGLLTFRRSLSFVVVVEYTLPVVLHILRVDRDDKGTRYAAVSLVAVRVSWDARRPGLVTVWGSLSFVVAVEYTLLVVLHILRVDSDDKGTGYAAGSLVAARVSWNARRRGLVTVWGSLSFVVAEEYTLSVVLHILRVDSDDKGTRYAAGSLVVARVSWDARRWGLVTVWGSLSFVVAVEYTLPVVLHILWVGRSDKGTGYAAGSLVVTRVSWDASRRGLVMVLGSLSFLVAVEYTLPVVLHIPPGGQLRQKKCCGQSNSLFVACCSPLNSIHVRLKRSCVPLRVLCGFQLLFPPIVVRIYYTSIYSFESY